MTAALDELALGELARTLPCWTHDMERSALHRRLKFSSFSAAFGAMTQIAIEAEKADHHPEWFNVYDRLDVWLTTHDVGGVSERDVNLARIIDRIVGS